MEIIKKYVPLLVLAIMAIGSVYFFFYRMYTRDIEELEDFLASYKKFDQAMSGFSTPVLASNPEGARTLDQFDKIYNQITASMQDPRPRDNRLVLAKKALSLNSHLLDDLNKTDDLESKAADALIELKTKAAARISSLIKNDGELMRTALEIADFSGKELDNLSAYKRAIVQKRDIIDTLLQNVVDDKGGLNGFNSCLKNNQTKITSQNADLDRLSKEFNDLINNRTTAYARFQGLGPH